MIILDDIEKLINEHGSASITRDNLAFLRDQTAALQRENATLKIENTSLKGELEACTSEKESLKVKLQELEAVIRKYDYDRAKVCEQSKKQPLHDDLPEEQMEILELLAVSSSMSDEEIIAAIDRKAESIYFDLGELKSIWLIESASMCGITVFNLTQEGRRYLKKLGYI